jgi:copper(I)-binding protein
MKRALLLLTALLAPSAWANNDIQVTDLVLREMLPGVKSTAGYFTLTNHSDKLVALQSVTGKMSTRIEIHEHLMENGMMQMQQVNDDLIIKAHEQLVFSPGGYHLMLFKPNRKIKKGEAFKLVLNFKTHKPITVDGKVVSVLEQQQKKQHKHHH